MPISLRRLGDPRSGRRRRAAALPISSATSASVVADGVSVGRPVDGVRSVHGLRTEGGGRVLHQGDVVAELRRQSRPVTSMQVLAIMPTRITWLMPNCLSCTSRSVLANPVDPQCSCATMSPGCGWKSWWSVPPHEPLGESLPFLGTDRAGRALDGASSHSPPVPSGGGERSRSCSPDRGQPSRALRKCSSRLTCSAIDWTRGHTLPPSLRKSSRRIDQEQRGCRGMVGHDAVLSRSTPSLTTAQPPGFTYWARPFPNDRVLPAGRRPGC